MKPTMTAIALALGLAGLAAPAAAATAQEEATAERQLQISEDAAPAILELQAALDAGNWAEFEAKLPAAFAAATTPDDLYYINNRILNAGLAQEDLAMQVRGVEGMAQSGWLDTATSARQFQALGYQFYNAGDYAEAYRLFAKSAELDGSKPELFILMGQALNQDGKHAEALAVMQRGIAAQKAATGSVDEDWYRRAIQAGIDGKLDNFNPLLLDWVRDYPASDNWRDALKLYAERVDWADEDLIDLWRLMRTAQALRGDRDHFTYARALLEKGYPAEAKALVDEAIAAGRIDGETDTFVEILALANREESDVRANLDADASSARSSSAMIRALSAGDTFYGYDRFAEAAEFYRLALSRDGADAGLLNLRLGAALARDGQFEAAKAALGQVEGKYAELAKFWMAWIDVQS